MLMSNSRLHAQKHARLKSPRRGFVVSVCLCVVRFIFDPTRAVTQTQQLFFFCVVHKLFFFFIFSSPHLYWSRPRLLGCEKGGNIAEALQVLLALETKGAEVM